MTTTDMDKGAREYGKKMGKLADEMNEAGAPVRRAAATVLEEIGMRQGIRLGTAGTHLGIVIAGGYQYGVAPGRWVDALLAMYESGGYSGIRALRQGVPGDQANDLDLYLETVKKIAMACLDEIEACIDPKRNFDVAMRAYLEMICGNIAQALLASGVDP